MLAFILVFGILAIAFLIVAWTTIAFKMKADQLGVSISWGHAFGMRLRRTLTNDILEAASLAVKANLQIDILKLETHKLAGGSPLKVVSEIIAAKQKGQVLEYDTAVAMDLAGPELGEILSRNKSENHTG